ncbi:MAG: hypothetical protein JSW03_05410 [Candidatus Eiseniibacteriota bacterium]|nr:MAG: hypothetical protein JSW03_05410 [Candidatus Eisenbacteria bacterium]
MRNSVEPGKLRHEKQRLVVLTCYILSLLLSLGTASTLSAVPDPVPSTYYQDLVELFNRKSMAIQKPSELLVEGGYWQSEKVIFHDVEYGSEVWRLSNDPDYTRHHNTVNKTPWNRDGSLISLFSSRYVPGLPHTGWFRFFVMDGNGNRFRLLEPHGVPNATLIPDYAAITAWDRTNRALMYFAYFDGLYSVDVSASDLMTLVEPLPFTDRRKVITTYLSEDNVLLVNEKSSSSYFFNIYMIDLKEAPGSPGRLIYYSTDFNITDVEGHSVENEWRYHDLMFMRKSTNSFSLNFGPSGDVGEYVTFEIPYDGNADDVTIAFTQYDPVLPYYSHPFWGADGRQVVYFGESSRGANDWGLQLRDHLTQTPVRTLTPRLKAGGGHTAWDGYDPDWVFASPTSWDWSGTIIKAKTDGSYSAPFVRTYTRLNGVSPDYSSYARPAQSPDGTKVLFTSSMLQNADDKTDVYIAVAKRPYPPRNVRGSSVSQSGVLIAWGAHDVSREVKGYHVYRSVDSDNNFSEISPGLVTSQEYLDTGVAAGHSYYYAVTSEEHSGLESDYLSNVIRADVSTGPGNWQNHRDEGQSGWDTIPPGRVARLQVSQLAPGVYELSWERPADNDVRYYNIYYSVAGHPARDQRRLIASPGGLTARYVDWQANPSYSPFYGVTAVDRAGNESAAAYYPPTQTDTTPPAPVGDLEGSSSP